MDEKKLTANEVADIAIRLHECKKAILKQIEAQEAYMAALNKIGKNG